MIRADCLNPVDRLPIRRMLDPKSVIPHRPPFLFIDEVIELDAEHAVCARTFRAEENFY